MSQPSAQPTPTSHTPRLVRAATIIMLAFVASRVLGFVREAVIGAQFGSAPEYGAYIAAFRLPDLLFNLIAGGALASAFLPTFATYLTREDYDGAHRLASAVATWLMVILGSVATLGAIFAPWLVETIIAPGFADPALSTLTANLMRLMLVSTVIFSLSGLVMSVLNAYEHFTMPAIAPVLYNVGIIFGALVLTGPYSIFGLAMGVVLGAAAHLLVQVPMLVRYHVRYTPLFGRRDPELWASVRQVAHLMTPRVLGAGVVQLMFLANTIIASFFSPSVLTALNYAWIVMLLPHGIFASSVATAVFPSFSKMVAVGDQDGMRRAFGQTLQAVLFVVLPAAVGLFVLRVPIIQLLFERGAFTHETTLAVAWALLFYAPGLIAHSLVEIITRAFFALKDTWTPVLIGAAAMLGNIGLSLLFVRVIGNPEALVNGPQGGLALANSLASTVEMLIMLWIIRRRLGGLGGATRSVVRAGAAALLMGGALWLLLQVDPFPALPILLMTPVAVALGGAIYFGSAWLLGVPETRRLPAMLLRRRA